jgi:hypothetical protein
MMAQMAQSVIDVEIIKQYPGRQQVERKVKVQVPGKHFPSLTAAEQKQFFDGTAVEFCERHKFPQHNKGWGVAHTGPGIRFLCESDAIDDPDCKGFWTTVALWNRWRHATYKDDREAEKQYLDELPAAAPEATEKEKKEKEAPEIKSWFTVVSTGEHIVGGAGKMAGKKVPAVWFACKTPGCARGLGNPIKITGMDTGGLFGHLDSCNPQLAKQVRLRSKGSRIKEDAEGEIYEEFAFNEALPHHVRYVQKCFRGLDHFYETRADNGLEEWVKGFDRRATLPHLQTANQILAVRLPPPPRGHGTRHTQSRACVRACSASGRWLPACRCTRSWSTRRRRSSSTSTSPSSASPAPARPATCGRCPVAVTAFRACAGRL